MCGVTEQIGATDREQLSQEKQITPIFASLWCDVAHFE